MNTPAQSTVNSRICLRLSFISVSLAVEWKIVPYPLDFVVSMSLFSRGRDVTG